MDCSLLKDLKVLDLTRVLAGPYCTLQLADLGAEVVKVEKPETGDDARFFGPFIGGQSAYFLSLNRNKKSITLNLKSARGQEIFKDLISKFDVLAGHLLIKAGCFMVSPAKFPLFFTSFLF